MPRRSRFLIKPWLDVLLESKVFTQVQGLSRDEQYQKLLKQTDPNSDFERVVLQEIYQTKYKLPDAIQELTPEANCKPDFIYKKEVILRSCTWKYKWIFASVLSANAIIDDLCKYLLQVT
ncbi:hypothetical protein ACN23B_11120 [Anabaena sp. FACHB-709]|uniref:Uncharacterized protein n=1 Tax=Anabaena cylindrica FACHB-318 TaxID=2692880 RepID=A0ABR7ZC70_ANACY|nr:MULTISPECIES: hypothetical protein [Nostocaceae]MBD2170070.1 hypothetical protein [Anabaena cylindrica FACHB-318]MBD2261509.1 hypothetical protein [Anabaena sp. FACHB-709]MBD2271093.1 hypothetical protein [Nostoc sp. PCC 7120 = FACHB-418]MBD2282635.1 hypothetical protein [Anabaena cylindrica FACHB-170]MBD2349394.1 hypothetical protein [Trichormus variabilis FACHB-171]